MEKIKEWLKIQGVEGILGLVAGIIFLVMKLYFFSGIAFGVFVAKNWEWILKGIKRIIKTNN